MSVFTLTVCCKVGSDKEMVCNKLGVRPGSSNPNVTLQICVTDNTPDLIQPRKLNTNLVMNLLAFPNADRQVADSQHLRGSEKGHLRGSRNKMR